MLKLISLDSIKVVGNGFTNELGKCRGGGGKYASVAIVIKHKQAASVWLVEGEPAASRPVSVLAGNPSDYSRSCRRALFPAANLVGTGPQDLCETEYGTQFGGITLLIYVLSFRVNFLNK